MSKQFFCAKVSGKNPEIAFFEIAKDTFAGNLCMSLHDDIYIRVDKTRSQRIAKIYKCHNLSHSNSCLPNIQIRVGKTGSLGPWSKFVVYCRKLSFCQNDSPIGGFNLAKRQLATIAIHYVSAPRPQRSCFANPNIHTPIHMHQ